jgi:hypothetical protein
MQFLEPSNKFEIETTLLLSNDQKLQLKKNINLHYLGDEYCNELVDGQFVPKYPEKETKHYKNVCHRIEVGIPVRLSVEFDVNGKPRVEVIQDD